MGSISAHRGGWHRGRLGSFHGFTIPEVLVVVGVIALLIAVLTPALFSAKRTADMTKSMNNLKQIATWMAQYSAEHREYIVPSQFDYSASATSGYPVKARSDAGLTASGLRYKGTWSDILWTYADLGESSSLIDPGDAANTDKYLYDSPDKPIFDSDPNFESPLRAAAPNTREYRYNCAAGTGPLPFGTGAAESSLPGFFAANNYFNTDPTAAVTAMGVPAAWYTTGQIRSPGKSMYLVDSFAGETINPVEIAGGERPFDTTKLWDCGGTGTPNTAPAQVDFRYSGIALMLCLDAHIVQQAEWTDLVELENNRRIKVRNLHQN